MNSMVAAVVGTRVVLLEAGAVWNRHFAGVVIEERIAVGDLPSDVTSTWQLVNLATGRDHKQFRVTLPITGVPALAAALGVAGPPESGLDAATVPDPDASDR